MKLKTVIAVWLILVIANCGSFSQSVYLTMDRGQIERLLQERQIEVGESDQEHIHAVDDRLLLNLIFYFSDGYCSTMVTTFQHPEGFLKLVGFMEANFRKAEEMCWVVPMENGVDVVKAYRKTGYDVIEENFFDNSSLE